MGSSYRFPKLISANYQTLCSSAQLTAFAKENPSSVSSLSVPKAPIFIQRRQNLGRVGVPLVPASKTASLSRTRESWTAPLAFPYSGKKRSLQEEVDHGDGAQAQTKTAQTKRVKEASESAPIALQVSDFCGPTPASNPVVEDHDEEAIDANEVVPQPCSSLREARSSKLGEKGVTAETPVPIETECPLVVGEIRTEGTVLEEINLEETEMPFPEDCASQVTEELEAENIAPEPTVEPTARTKAGHNLGASRAEKFEIPAMSKDKAKLMLAKWVTLSTEERVGEEQRGKVCDALDALSPTYPGFASSFETAKSDMLALADKFKHNGPAQFYDDLAQLEAELARSRNEIKAQHKDLEKYELLWKQADWHYAKFHFQQH
ncbi:unnamed protein product [Prunus brigantina]